MPAALTISPALFGKHPGPARFEQLADWLYRGVMLTALLAYASLWWQIDGLIGSHGIAPATEFLDAVRDQYGSAGYLLMPTLAWLSASDAFLNALCALGSIACLLGVLGRARVTAALLAYIAYLSLFYAGQVFMGYQWDLLLIECLFLCAVLAVHATWGVWLFRLLLFRFMFLSGAVKLLSGDPTWADASALTFHFETQPLPTALAWYAHQLPEQLLALGVRSTFLIELVLPFFIFAPRNLRLVACAGFVLLELLIMLTGSYNFFNLLTIVMCAALLDDHMLQRLPRLRGIAPRASMRYPVMAAGCLLATLGLLVVLDTVVQTRMVRPLLAMFEPLHAVNRYGLFAVMTTERHELIIEGSPDGVAWRPYMMPFNPGDISRRPKLAAPHQPRLDWQLWFAALTSIERAPWMYGFVDALLRAEPAVLALIDDPFDGRRPLFVRVVRYRYRFTTAAEHDASGDWWVRDQLAPWSPVMRLRSPIIRHDPLEL